MRCALTVLLLSSLTACVAHSTVPDPVPVFFGNASTQLGPEARQSVAAAAAVAQKNPGLHVQLVGYGLPTGMPAEPARLSAARAMSVRDELVRDGVTPARILDYAGGALTPAADSAVQSRRVDVSFVR